MLRRESLHHWGIITLFLFAWSCLSAGLLPGADEDPLETARQLIKAGSFEEAERVLGAYIEKIRGIAKQKRHVAAAHYLLARMYFEAGDDRQCDENLRSALKYDQEIGREESSADFRKRVDGIWEEMATRAAEKEGKSGPARKRFRKKFPWLLVAGAAVAVVIAVFLLKKKKEFTLTVTVSEGVAGFPKTGSFLFPRGASAPYQFEASSDYKDLVVKIDGTISPASGTLIMDRDIRLEASATPMSAVATLSVHGLHNCQELVKSPAVLTSVPAGFFSLQKISGKAYLASGVPFASLAVLYYNGDLRRYCQAVIPIPLASSLHIGDPYGSELFSFFIDSGPVSDNSGSVTLDFGSFQVKVFGQGNCFQLNNLPTAKVTIPAGSYRVRISGSAYFYSQPMKEILVGYAAAGGALTWQALSVDGISTISTAGGILHAFFAMRYSRPDTNSGQITMDFLR